MTSDAGLNVYGAATWGQFFIYQGFTPHIGFMHTSSGVDVVDEFLETIVRRGGALLYRYGAETRPVTTASVTIAYRTASGAMASRRFTVFRTGHGPIIGAEGDKWLAFAMMYKPVAALSQSFLRTKAVDYTSFVKVADAYKANSSNNTVFADDKGEIAYLHPQFIPRRDDRFDYTQPVDGADPATDWRGDTPLIGDAAPFEPGVGLHLQFQRRPLERRRPRQPEPRRLSQIHGPGRLEPPRPARPSGADRAQGLHPGRSERRRLRFLSAGIRHPDPPASGPLTTPCRRAMPARRRWPSRSRPCAAGTCAGAPRRYPPPWR